MTNTSLHLLQKLMRSALVIILAVALAPKIATAQISILSTGTPYSENFDLIGSTATAALPSAWRVSSAANAIDWATGLTACTQAAGTTGTGVLTGTSTGGTYNFANGVTASSTERAVGFITTGSFASARSIIVAVTNNTGATVTSLNVAFDYEKYRSGSRQFNWTFFHGATSSPATSATAGDQSYLADANNTVISNPPTTISKSFALTGLSIADGSSYYLRWTYTGLAGSTNAQAIGLDNFSVTAGGAPPVTTPSTIAFGATTPTSVVVNFSPLGNGVGRILVVRQGSAVGFTPVNGTTYSGDNSNFTLGAALGGGDILVYNAAGNTVTVTGLTSNTTYYFKTYDYDGSTNYSASFNTNFITTPVPPGPILYAGGTYTQTFDGLPASGTVTTTGLGNGPFYLSESPVGATGMLGWQYAKTAGTGDARFFVDAGGSTSGGVYSYGTGSSTDRSLGSLGSGASNSVVYTFGALIQNTSAQVYTSITVSFTGEQWRAGGGIINSLAFQYSVGASNLTTGTFTAEPNLNFVAPTHSPINSPLDGNAAANQVAVTYTLPLNQNWDPGQTLVIRWNELDDTGNDDGVAIDGMSFSAAGVSAPTVQDLNIVASNTLTVSSDISWTNGDGSNHLVILNTANTFTDPGNGSVPTANTVYAGSGQQVVYNGTGSTVNVTGLSPSTQYFARVYGFNGTGSAATYILSTATNNPNSFTTAAPVPPTKLVITSLNGGNPILQNTPFSITVQTQDATNSPQDVTAPTTVTLTLNNGFGTLSGTLSGVITTGNTVTITGILYDIPDNPVILDANVTAGPALTGTSTAPFEVFGIATDLSFSTVPANGVVNQTVGNIQVQALRADFSVDVNYTGAITISVFSGAGNMLGTLTQNAFSGVATFSGISFDAADTYVLQANATGLTPGNSSPIVITLPATMTELVVPQYMGSKSAASTNANRTPFAVCLQFNNLVPGSSYDLRAGLALTSDAATTFGAGSIWNGLTYGTSNLTNLFTADGTGSSGPVWVFIQPTGNTTRFDAGQVHNLRISIGINGQGVPNTPSFISTKTITALDIATTARTPATTDDGAYVRGTAVACTGGKLVLIYANTAGTGDPLSVFQVRTTTPSDITASNYSGHPTSIADIYLQSGTSNIGDYPGVVPIGANNASGVQRIELRNLDNTVFNAITDADGIWPGGADFTTIARRGVGQIGLPADPTLSTAPAVTPGTYGPACSNDLDITLGGTPPNGVWTGTGVSGSYVFSPSAGSQTLTYTYTDANNCFSDGTTSVTVNTATQVSCPANTSTCLNTPAFTLTGASQPSATYSGPGVNAGVFDPAVAGQGTHTITVSYTDGNSCTTTCQFTITVNPLPNIFCPANFDVCIDAVAFTLTGGNPFGGTYTGTGVSGGSFDPAVAGVGTHTIWYSYTDVNGCTNAPCGFTITVNALPVVTCPANSSVCINTPSFALTGGSPAGGTYSGTGVSGGNFDPAAAGVGTHTITYSYTDGNTCTNTCTFDITVNALPVVTCPADISGICSTDAAFALTGGSPAGGTYSGTGVSGGNFDPATANIGANLITYTYSDGTCTNTCTFTITVTQATTWYGDLIDGDGLGDPNVTLLACTQPSGYVANNTDLCPLVSGTVGSSCDDGNCFTINDVLNGSCVCVGTPVACSNWTLTINLDGSPTQTTWQIVEDGGSCVLASGGPYAIPNSVVTANVCVPLGGCFKLVMNDSGNNGIAGGGWLLTDNTGKRIVDNVGNGACFTNNSTTGTAFCNEPASMQTLIASNCDRENWLSTEVITASANTAVSAQWGIGVQTDDGYQFWFENPCGGYSRRIFRDHATSGGNGPANAIRATKLKLSTIVTNPLPANTLLNVRVRARVNGVDGNWGPACRFKIDPNACTLTKLNDIPGDPNLSCGVTGKQVGASGQVGKIYAKVVFSGGNPATNYRFEFSQVGEGYLRNITTTSAALLLSPWVTNPLLCGTYLYAVRVQASFDGGATYCPFGQVCTVEITNNAPHPCTTPGNFTGGGDRTATEVEMEFAMYPNPNNGDQLFINMSELGDNVSLVTMDMFDIFGKKVMSRTFAVQEGTMNTVIDLDDSMAAGLYLVNITAGDVTRTERLVIQH